MLVLPNCRILLLTSDCEKREYLKEWDDMLAVHDVAYVWKSRSSRPLKKTVYCQFQTFAAHANTSHASVAVVSLTYPICAEFFFLGSGETESTRYVGH
jgi:hypothetical protein